MIAKRIYITHESGMDVLVPYIEQGIKEIFDSFPAEKRYKEYFPVQNLGDWKDDGYLQIRNGNTFLQPYKSVEWYIARAKEQAKLDGRYNPVTHTGQISVDQLEKDLNEDPYAKKIPQYSILLTRQDLYGADGNGGLLNFCNGVTIPGRFCVVSIARFMNNGGLDNLGLGRFQSVVMHEFGHLIGLTPEGRANTYEQLGTHCRNGDIMEQELSGTGKKILENRIRRHQRGLPPICNDCIAAGERFLDKEIYLSLSRQRLNAFSSGYNR